MKSLREIISYNYYAMVCLLFWVAIAYIVISLISFLIGEITYGLAVLLFGGFSLLLTGLIVRYGGINFDND